MVNINKNQIGKFVWVPRIIAILYIIVLMLFSMDVFVGESSLLEKLEGFFIHSLPSFVLLIVLVLTWSRPKIGGILFVAMCVYITITYSTYVLLDTFLLLSLPPFTTGILLLLVPKHKIKQ